MPSTRVSPGVLRSIAWNNAHLQPDYVHPIYQVILTDSFLNSFNYYRSINELNCWIYTIHEERTPWLLLSA